PLSWPVTCLPHSVVLQSQQWLYATHWNTVTIRSSSYSHFVVFLALFTASCKVRGRSGWSNWYGQVLQWQGGGQVGERNPAPRVDERNRDVSTTIVRPPSSSAQGPSFLCCYRGKLCGGCQGSTLCLQWHCFWPDAAVVPKKRVASGLRLLK